MLTRVSPKNANILLEMLRKRLPHSQPIFNSVDMAIKYDAHFFKFFTKEKSSSLVAATDRHPLTDVQILNIFWDTTEHSNEEVHDFLKQIPTLQWGRPIYLNFVNSSLTNNLNDILSSSELIGGKLKKLRYDLIFYGLSKKLTPFKNFVDDWPGDLTPSSQPITPEFTQKILKLGNEILDSKIPEGFEMLRLREKDLGFVLSNWYQRPVDPNTFIDRFRKIPAVAIYKKGDSESLPMTATIISSYGLPSSGYTSPEYRNKGLGQIGLLAVMFEMISKRLWPSTTTRNDRRDLLPILKNVGFDTIKETFHEIYYNEEDPSIILKYF